MNTATMRWSMSMRTATTTATTRTCTTARRRRVHTVIGMCTSRRGTCMRMCRMRTTCIHTDHGAAGTTCAAPGITGSLPAARSDCEYAAPAGCMAAMRAANSSRSRCCRRNDSSSLVTSRAVAGSISLSK